MSCLGMVLSGGGARGAYEVGVLSHVFGDLCSRLGRAPRFDILSGTSVGAVNCAAVAATAADPARGTKLLEQVWLQQELSQVLHFNLRQVLRLYRVWLGGSAPAGIFDSRRLATVISRSIPWRQMARNIKAGRIRALTVSATNIGTGRTTVYIDRAPGMALPPIQGRLVIRATHILPQHVLASAAMPIIFPAVRIGNEYFCDGGIRMNTPTSPAIHLGADRLFVVGVSTPGTPRSGQKPLSMGRAPSASSLLGKALDGLMLDHISHDLEEIALVNEVLSNGVSAYGSRFLDTLNREAVGRSHSPRRILQTMVLNPSIDMGSMANEYLRANRLRLGKFVGRTLLAMLDVGENADADLASYLLFDTDFLRLLIDLGRHDAALRSDELEQFLFAA